MTKQELLEEFEERFCREKHTPIGELELRIKKYLLKAFDAGVESTTKNYEKDKIKK